MASGSCTPSPLSIRHTIVRMATSGAHGGTATAHEPRAGRGERTMSTRRSSWAARVRSPFSPLAGKRETRINSGFCRRMEERRASSPPSRTESTTTRGLPTTSAWCSRFATRLPTRTVHRTRSFSTVFSSSRISRDTRVVARRHGDSLFVQAAEGSGPDRQLGPLRDRAHSGRWRALAHAERSR